jgi:ubiquinone/menaquinone biosynthesis C-methylase UbiE
MFNEVSEAFTRQSEIFDQYEKGNEILKWMRAQTQIHVSKYLKRGDEILELNSGTGIDAVFFAEMGHKVFCTDISSGMLHKLKEKIKKYNFDKKINSCLLSYMELDKLGDKSFDYIFSNFGGINCTGNPSQVFTQFKKILKPGGIVSLVIIPPICPWELALVFKGNFKTAFRRLHKNGIKANVEGVKFQIYYYSANKIRKALGNNFNVLEIQGLASVSPPPYMDNFPRSYPNLYKILTRIDENVSHLFPFNKWADHFILTAEYRPQ